MSQQNGRTGLLLSVLGAIVLMVAGYLLLVKPQLDAATSANEERDYTISDNETLQSRLVVLKELATHVDEWQADLDAIGEQMPSLPETDALERLLVSTGETAGVAHVESRVEAIVPIDGEALSASGDATAASGAVDTATATAGTEDAGTATTGTEDAGTEDAGTEDGVAATADATDGTTATSETVAGPVVEGLVAIQFSVVVEGTSDSVLKFINLLHTQQDRYMTLSGFAILRSDGAEASPGRPALAVGDWSVTVNAMAFVVIDATSPVEVDELDGVEPFTGTVRNPFQPVTP